MSAMKWFFAGIITTAVGCSVAQYSPAQRSCIAQADAEAWSTFARCEAEHDRSGECSTESIASAQKEARRKCLSSSHE